MRSEAQAVSGQLVKYADSVSNPPKAAQTAIKRRSRLADRLDLLDKLRGFTSQKRLRACGRWRINGGEPVTLHVGTTGEGERVSYLTNVQRCGSPWMCPTCGPKIRQQRAGEIEQAALAHIEQGGALYTMIVTLPHDAPDRLADTWDVLREGYRRMMGGRGWREDKEACGIEGYIRADEVTHGNNGWHPHAHPLIFAARELSPNELETLADRMHGRWSRYVQKRGYRAPSRGLCDLHPVQSGDGIAAYIVKAGLHGEGETTARLGLEMARGDLKRGRETESKHKTESVWAIAERAASGSERDRVLWREWERESKGKWPVRWSRGLKARYAVGEQTDEELAAAEAETASTERLDVSPGEWDIVSAKPGAVSTLRLIAELLGMEHARGFVVATVAAHVERRLRTFASSDGTQTERAPP